MNRWALSKSGKRTQQRLVGVVRRVCRTRCIQVYVTKRGRQIMYRANSYDLWLKKREIDYDEMREAKPKRRANARRK